MNILKPLYTLNWWILWLLNNISIKYLAFCLKMSLRKQLKPTLSESENKCMQMIQDSISYLVAESLCDTLSCPGNLSQAMATWKYKGPLRILAHIQTNLDSVNLFYFFHNRNEQEYLISGRGSREKTTVALYLQGQLRKYLSLKVKQCSISAGIAYLFTSIW